MKNLWLPFYLTGGTALSRGYYNHRYSDDLDLFVNDVESHFGTIKETPVYYKTDSVRNILSNKYTALYRISTKDVVEVVEIFFSFDDDDFSKIKWINKPNLNILKTNIDKIVYDMITLGRNSLYL